MKPIPASDPTRRSILSTLIRGLHPLHYGRHCSLGADVMAVAMLAAMGLVPAGAASLVESSASTGVSQGVDASSQSSGTVSSQNSGAFGSYTAESRSQASFGVLRAYSEAHAAKTNGSGGVSSGAEASFSDNFTVNAADKTGQAGTITIKVGIHGSLSGALRTEESEQFTAQSYSRARLYVTKDRLTNPITFPHTTRFTAYDQVTAVTEGQPFMNQVVSLAFPIVFGTPFELQVTLQSGTFAREKFGADCIGDLGNTAEWEGIASVTDSEGSPVAGYTVISGTGTDYTRSIRYDPQITEFAVNAGVPRVSFTTLSGRSYTVESTSNLANAAWLPLSNATSVNGTGAILHVTDPAPETGTPSARFYRVGLHP